MNNLNLITTRFFIESSIAYKAGLDDYCKLINLYDNGKGCSNESFQKHFTHFYRVRRSTQWLKEYYSIMGHLSKRPQTPFSECLRLVDGIHGSGVEISFSSKLLHTINPDMPIWDSRVKKTLDLADISAGSKSEKEDSAIASYAELCSTTSRLLSSERIRDELREFDTVVPNYAHRISQMKKLDFLLWAAGK